MPDRPEAAARDDLDLPALFAGLDGLPALLLAVSGGPDSMALLHLATCWRASLSAGPALAVATVDHGLRAGSSGEAGRVAAAAAAYRLPHATLPWIGPKPTAAVQERAREARYRLLAAHARAIGAPVLLTAHHADDQAETVLMRLGRGSGVAGLAAMRRVSPLGEGVSLVRPLLALTKADLVSVCVAQSIDFVTDPSNADPAYHRVRLRQQAEAAAALGLDRPALLRLARRMARAEEALDAEVTRRLEALRPLSEPGLWRADLAAGGIIAAEILQRIVGRAVRHVAGPAILPLERLEAKAEAVRAALAEGRAWQATLGGALLALDAAGTLTVSPEPQRRRGRPRPD